MKKLDYYSPAPSEPGRKPPPLTPYALGWRMRRRLYRSALYLIAALFAFYFIPNLIMFGKITWLNPDDYAVAAQRDLTPVIIAAKQYHQDFGQFPTDFGRLVPHYLADDPRRDNIEIENNVVREVAVHVQGAWGFGFNML